MLRQISVKKKKEKKTYQKMQCLFWPSHGHLLFYVTLKQNVLNFSYKTKKRDLSMPHFNSHVFKYT